MNRRLRIGVREGYDLWAESYDVTPNAVIAADSRYTLNLLSPRRRECVLDAGCGTGRNLRALLAAGSRAYGLDFSFGMLKVARRNIASVSLVQGDLQRELPFRSKCFDAILCTLIGEHLKDLRFTLEQFNRVLFPGGRLVFSVYHPDLAQAGKVANFNISGIEYRLGAIRYTVDDYLNLIDAAGLRHLRYYEFEGDPDLMLTIPEAENLIGKKVLLVIEARKAALSCRGTDSC